MEKQADNTPFIEHNLLRLFIYMDKAWKVALASALGSGVATVVLLLLFFSPITSRTLIRSLLISTLIAVPASYLIGAMFLIYHRLLEKRNQELLLINRELNAFAHTVAHDLRSPLSTLSGYIETLLILLPDMEPAEIESSLRMMQRSSLTMHQIIDDLLLLAETRSENVQMSPLDMKEIVTRSQERVQSLLESTQGEIRLPDAWPSASGYAPWVEAVWVNYLSNGLKYGGSPPQLELGARETGNAEVEFWVRDNGPGINLEDQPLLFNEFIRLEQGRIRARGSGLGLSIVQRIVTRLGGRVGVESQPGQGSRFYFTLPPT